MGFWHRAKVILGLADDFDEEYEDYDQRGYDDDDDEAYAPSTRSGGSRSTFESVYPDPPSVHPVRRDPEAPRPRDVGLRSVGSSGWDSDASQPQVKMHITEPRSFSEAQSIADKLKAGTPVIMNLTMTEPDLAKRLIDFASGLTYGLDGGLQKVADRVFMLTPANVAVSAEDRRRLRDKGLFSLDG